MRQLAVWELVAVPGLVRLGRLCVTLAVRGLLVGLGRATRLLSQGAHSDRTVTKEISLRDLGWLPGPGVRGRRMMALAGRVRVRLLRRGQLTTRVGSLRSA